MKRAAVTGKTICAALADCRLQPLGHVSGQIIKLASLWPCWQPSIDCRLFAAFLHQDIEGCRLVFWCNRKDMRRAKKTESPGEEIGTEALHCEGDDPHAKHRITIDRRLVCPERHCAVQKKSPC